MSVATPRWVGQIPETRTCFAMFGFLSQRKGIFETLAALELLDDDAAAATAVVFAGVFEPSARQQFNARLEVVRDKAPRLWVHVEERYLDQHEIVALLHRADVVLAPYQRFVGSSGVIFWAVGAGRPVITQDYGFLGELVRRHRLGLAVDTRDPEAIAGAMRRCIDRPLEEVWDVRAMTRLAEEHTPARFGMTILETISSTAAR
jgi:glycosyltransferase involved in cell wall biosynthesis